MVKLSKKHICFFLAGLCIIAYFNSIHGEFIIDDLHAVVNNPQIENLWASALDPALFCNALSYRIGKLDVAPHHIVSIIVHCLNTILVFFFLQRFYGQEPSLAGAALFAVHPVHVEAVSWISGRTYLLLAFFVLMTYLLYEKATRLAAQEKKAYAVFYLLSLLIFSYFINSQFSYYSFLPLFLVFSDCVSRRWRRTWKLWIPFFAIVVLRLFLLSGMIMTRVATETFKRSVAGSADNPLLCFVYSFFAHLWLLLWPARLAFYRDPHIFLPWMQVAGVMVMGILVACLPYLYKKDRRICLGLAVFILFLAPTYSPWPVASLVAERYAYVPSLFLSICIASCYERYARKTDNRLRIWFVFMLALVLVVCMARTVLRNADWRTQRGFWQATVAASPYSARAHNNLGIMYKEAGNYEKAIEELGIAIKLSPRFLQAYNNLGGLYIILGRYEEAARSLKKAIEINPSYVGSYHNMGRIYFEKGDIGEAISWCKRALEVAPDDLRTLNFISQLFVQQGDYEGALHYLQRALRINARDAQTHLNLAFVYYRKKEYHSALTHCREALRLGDKVPAHFLDMLESYTDFRH